MLLEPITNKIVYKEAQGRIKRFVLDGNMQPGDRLPLENDFASQLGVRRIIIFNAAVQVLHSGV